ncbi:hypothetical protein CYMTET_5486 [Cymbomonas tetramitiformis]|uniref:Uncharacterized protein n=1 Tax=Cymbomonas tetramitiformis TaxID=36881 RepID=A0AAE0GZ73_9CHLO|nr:hypothetical protein CYMTET_5486 [Cymbomonas tetramitiformis]
MADFPIAAPKVMVDRTNSLLWGAVVFLSIYLLTGSFEDENERLYRTAFARDTTQQSEAAVQSEGSVPQNKDPVTSETVTTSQDMTKIEEVARIEDVATSQEVETSKELTTSQEVSTSKGVTNSEDVATSQELATSQEVETSKDLATSQEVETRQEVNSEDVAKSQELATRQEVETSQEAETSQKVSTSQEVTNSEDVAKSQEVETSKDLATSQEVETSQEVTNSEDAETSQDVAISKESAKTNDTAKPSENASVPKEGLSGAASVAKGHPTSTVLSSNARSVDTPFQLVVSTSKWLHEQNLSWTAPYHPVVYRAGRPLPPSEIPAGVEQPIQLDPSENAPAEALHYLDYILRNYDALPAVVAFLQAYVAQYSPDWELLLRRPHKWLELQPLGLSYRTLRIRTGWHPHGEDDNPLGLEQGGLYSCVRNETAGLQGLGGHKSEKQ